jgi:hypothetical protein
MSRLLIAAAALALAASPAFAQEERAPIYVSSSRNPDVRQLPRDIAEEVIRYFNAAGTVRFSGITRIPAARGIDGDVAVLGGPVTLAGRISGSLYVINGDITFEPGAVVGGDVLVVGGTILGQSNVAVAGEVRGYRDVLRYRRAADDLVYAPQRDGLVRWRRQRANDSRASFVLALGGVFNRVEGAPIVFGPRLNVRLSDGARFLGDARFITRTGENFSLDAGRFGYRLRGEVAVGSRLSDAGFGVRAYDQVSPVESWPLRDYESGWAAFLLRSDYRDWYRHRGYGVYAALRPSRQLTLTVEGRQEDVFSQAANNPWALFNGSRTWRENPAVSDGSYRSAVVGLRLDTRDDRSAPSSGIFLNAEFESSEGRRISGTVDPNLVCITAPCVPASLQDGQLTFQRAWLDARTYVQLTPAGRLALRLAGGGKLGGDDLPLQRRVSLGFPDPLPGYNFRAQSCGGENFQGSPALCDRAVVAQVELRTHLGFDFGPDWANDWGDEEGAERWEPFHVNGPDIVAFADAGYAWSVGSGPTQLAANRLPSLRLWQPDIGIGLDLGPIGAYFAKSIGPVHHPLTFTVRMGRRF